MYPTTISNHSLPPNTFSPFIYILQSVYRIYAWLHAQYLTSYRDQGTVQKLGATAF